MTAPPSSKSWERLRNILVEDGEGYLGLDPVVLRAKCRARSVYGQLELKLVALLLLLTEVAWYEQAPFCAPVCRRVCAGASPGASPAGRLGRRTHRAAVLRCWGLGPWWAVIEAT